MDFATPLYLWFLAGAPLLAVALTLLGRWRQQAVAVFVGAARAAGPGQGRQALAATILVLAVALVAIALARPQIGHREAPLKRQGVDVMLVLDVSQSMQAQDVRPSRLERAKEELARLVERLPGHRVGLVIFAGSAFPRFPLTDDMDAASQLLLAAAPLSRQMVAGSFLSAAIKVATKGLEESDTPSKVMILVTDGEDHGSDPLTAAQQAAEKGIVIHTVGVGTRGGAVIPTLDSAGRPTLKRDPFTGELAVTRLNPDLLRDIAAAANGHYWQLGEEPIASALADAIEDMPQSVFSQQTAQRPIERFQPFALAALALLVAELLLREYRPLRRTA